MTVKEELHALVDRLPDEDASHVLEYLRTRVEHGGAITQEFVEDAQRALEEATAPGAPRVPHEAVRTWMRAWGTAEEESAANALREAEGQARRRPNGKSG